MLNYEALPAWSVFRLNPKREMSVEVFFLSKQWATCCLNSVGGFIVLSVSDLIAIQCRFRASDWNPGPCPRGKKVGQKRCQEPFFGIQADFRFRDSTGGVVFDDPRNA
jgi:hypothetical protein